MSMLKSTLSRETLIKELNKKLTRDRLVLKGATKLVFEFPDESSKEFNINISKDFVPANTLISHILNAFDNIVAQGKEIHCFSIVANICDYVMAPNN